ncbi:MAG: SIS domain-containing protein [Polyangiaceae bacterium]|nr:SIS domain-containing protein [Polyangiaceae bacterium]
MNVPIETPSATATFLAEVRASLGEIDAASVEHIADLLAEAWRSGARVFVMGNGGSAATASHFVCDLHGATRGERTLGVLCLSDAVPLLTALANDRGYENVFAEQLVAHARPGDVAIVLSASGSSENVVRAVHTAAARGVHTVGILGFGGGKLAELVEARVVVRSTDFGVVESVHATVTHLLAARVRARVHA